MRASAASQEEEETTKQEGRRKEGRWQVWKNMIGRRALTPTPVSEELGWQRRCRHVQ
jgi:hypothetical protein